MIQMNSNDLNDPNGSDALPLSSLAPDFLSIFSFTPPQDQRQAFSSFPFPSQACPLKCEYRQSKFKYKYKQSSKSGTAPADEGGRHCPSEARCRSAPKLCTHLQTPPSAPASKLCTHLQTPPLAAPASRVPVRVPAEPSSQQTSSIVMVRTRSGFDTNEPAPKSQGCCKKVLREFWLFILDLTILLVGVLRAPITGRVLLALVTRLLLYATNGVTLYALAAAVLQNGRPATPTGDEQFLAEMVNAILQPLSQPKAKTFHSA